MNYDECEKSRECNRFDHLICLVCSRNLIEPIDKAETYDYFLAKGELKP